MISQNVSPFPEEFLYSILLAPLIIFFVAFITLEDREANINKFVPVSTSPIKSYKDFLEFFKKLDKL